MSRVQLASLGAGVGQTALGAVTPNAPGTIAYHDGSGPFPVYADETTSTADMSGAFITDALGHVPGWGDVGALVDITIPPANTVTVPIPARLTAVTVNENYDANPGELIRVDASAGDVTITFPESPADGTPMLVVMIAQGIDPTRLAPSQIIVQPSGSDTFGPGDPDFLPILFSPSEYLYSKLITSWDIRSDSQSLIGLNTLYVNLLNPSPVTGPFTADLIGTNGSAGFNPGNFLGWLSYTGPPVGPSPRADGSYQSGDWFLGPGAAVWLNNQGVWVGGAGGSTPPPTIVSGAATPFTQTTATLNGTINPNNQTTTYQFQIGTTTAYGTNSPGSPGVVGSDDNVYSLSANITGLTPNTLYHWRLNAIVGTTTFNGPDQTFTTDPTSPAPTVGTGFVVGSPTSTTATVGAPVNPNGVPTNCVLNYGLTAPTYGSVSPPTGSQNAGSGNSLENIEFNLTGLTPNTTYHCQLVATNTTPLTTNSADFTFTTAAGGAPAPVVDPVIS